LKDLSELRIYILTVEIAEEIWEEVVGWENLAKWTLGKQLTEAADGIAATMIEGYYRHSSRDQAKFFRYALSSAKETTLWWWRAKNRNFISLHERYDCVRKKLDDLLPQTTNYIKSLANR
jgi:four helix bundle protein